MDVLAAAAAIGLITTPGTDALGTIEEDAVLDALAALAVDHPGHDDLFEAAATRVLLSRSAGLERIEADSVFAVGRASLEIQLRYRAEMLEVFTDLAIDLALSTPSAVASVV